MDKGPPALSDLFLFPLPLERGQTVGRERIEVEKEEVRAGRRPTPAVPPTFPLHEGPASPAIR